MIESCKGFIKHGDLIINVDHIETIREEEEEVKENKKTTTIKVVHIKLPQVTWNRRGITIEEVWQAISISKLSPTEIVDAQLEAKDL